MRQAVLDVVGRELALDALARAARAVPVGVSALDHETLNDAMEGQAVVEALVGKAAEV